MGASLPRLGERTLLLLFSSLKTSLEGRNAKKPPLATDSWTSRAQKKLFKKLEKAEGRARDLSSWAGYGCLSACPEADGLGRHSASNLGPQGGLSRAPGSKTSRVVVRCPEAGTRLHQVLHLKSFFDPFRAFGCHVPGALGPFRTKHSNLLRLVLAQHGVLNRDGHPGPRVEDLDLKRLCIMENDPLSSCLDPWPA